MTRITAIVFIGLVVMFALFSNDAYAVLPTLGTITPSSGSTVPNIAKTFTCTYSDASGATHLKEAYLLINTSSTLLTNTVYLYYDENTNLLYIRDDANSAWLGGYIPGSANIIENSRVKLNCAATTISKSGNTLTVAWNITFKAAYSGYSYNTYLKAVDDTALSAGWTKKGTYTVNIAPSAETITPSSGRGQAGPPQIFTTTYSDPDGWQNIQYVYLQINSSTSGVNCFYGYYNQNTNKLYLRNYANSAWLGGNSPGSSYIIDNSYTKLNCASTTISGSGTTLVVNWSVTFIPSFTGPKNSYLYVRDDTDAYQNWTQKGTWNMNQFPTITNMAPADSSSFTEQDVVTISVTATDPDGDSLQYQYSVDGAIKQPWTTASTYNWQTQIGDIKNHTIKVETKDPYNYLTSKQNTTYIFRKPVMPPQR